MTSLRKMLSRRGKRHGRGKPRVASWRLYAKMAHCQTNEAPNFPDTLCNALRSTPPFPIPYRLVAHAAVEQVDGFEGRVHLLPQLGALKRD